MRDPDLLISKLGTIDALCLRAIVINDNLAALHHEARDDALEYSRSIVQIQTKLSCAKCSEVFDCARNLLLEQFHDDPSLLVALLSLCTDLDVHETLDMAHVESWHAIVDARLPITIQARHEYLRSCFSFSLILTLICSLYFCFAVFPVLSQCLVSLLQFNCLPAVGKCL